MRLNMVNYLCTIWNRSKIGHFFCKDHTYTMSLVRGGNKMYAIVTTGGKQYKVSQDDIINVEKLDAKVGDKINLDVMMLVDGEKVTNGNPLVKGAEVVAEVLEHGKEDKIVVFKYKAKKNYRRKQGHRQPFTALKIVSVK